MKKRYVIQGMPRAEFVYDKQEHVTITEAEFRLRVLEALDRIAALEARAEAGVTEAIKKVEIVVGPGQVFYRLVDGVLTVWAGNGLEFADEDVMRVRIGPDHTKWVMTSTLSQGN